MTATEQRLSTGVLVIGTGGSGLRAAIELAERGMDVLAVGKRPRADAHTALAAGGINAALATMDPADTWQQHAADTLKESYLLANPHTVRIVTEGAARGIEDLVRYGMPFAREADGRISLRFFGAHTWRRTAFAGDYTGLEIQRTLVDRAAQLQVAILRLGRTPALDRSIWRDAGPQPPKLTKPLTVHPDAERGGPSRNSAHFSSASSAGHSACPQLVRQYSTLGGT
jgi:succinate dehydrogenase/fumarate reductase flavoprotein subunit